MAERRTITREIVENAFRYILGREVKDDAAVAACLKVQSEAGLRKILIRSAEFAGQYKLLTEDRPEGVAAECPLPPAADVETDAEGEDRERLWRRVSQTWRRLGEESPHWSVMSWEDFKPERYSENAARFIATAEDDRAVIERALARFPGVDPKALRCVELGCGVGRVTRPLAEIFGTVLGLDVSEPHLRLAEAHAKDCGLTNVTFRRIAEVADYATLPEADFFYSRIVLQHNPPPVQKAILAAVLGRLAPGGIALFQVLSRSEGYSYRLAEDLDLPAGEMEMHVLPQRDVFEVLQRLGFSVVEVQADTCCGPYANLGAHLFLAQRA